MVQSEGQESAWCEIGQLIGSHASVTEPVNWEDCQVKLHLNVINTNLSR